MGPFNVRLETRRLLLRPLDVADADVFSYYRSDPEVARYQGWNPPYTVEKALAFIDAMKHKQSEIPGEWYQLGIVLKGRAELVGDCAFHILPEDPRQAEIGFTLSRRHQGRGYATEAVSRLFDYLFGDLGLHRVRAFCDVENARSARVLERLGMRREAHLVENIWFKGRWGSEYMYAVLQREWLVQSRGAASTASRPR